MRSPLRFFGLHRDVNDAHRTGANRLQNKTTPLNLRGTHIVLEWKSAQTELAFVELAQEESCRSRIGLSGK